jgi:hypothetical protein
MAEVPRFPWLVVVTGLVFGLVGLGCLALLPGEYADSRAVVGAPTCGGTDTGDCLSPVPGRMDLHRSSSRGLSTRHHFQPSDRSVEGAWVRLAHDEFASERTPEMSRLLRGAPVTGLYRKGEPVAFEVEGTRIGTLDYDRDGWTGVLWGALLFLPFGGLSILAYRSWRRLKLEPAATGPSPDALWAGALVGSMLGAIGAFFPETARNQVVTYAVVTGGFVALTGWFRARQARSRSMDRARDADPTSSS